MSEISISLNQLCSLDEKTKSTNNRLLSKFGVTYDIGDHGTKRLLV